MLDHEIRNVLSFCYDQACGGHFSGKKTAAKVLQCGFSLADSVYGFL